VVVGRNNNANRGALMGAVLNDLEQGNNEVPTPTPTTPPTPTNTNTINGEIVTVGGGR
jgi:hypothetical protein